MGDISFHFDVMCHNFLIFVENVKGRRASFFGGQKVVLFLQRLDPFFVRTKALLCLRT